MPYFESFGSGAKQKTQKHPPKPPRNPFAKQPRQPHTRPNGVAICICCK